MEKLWTAQHLSIKEWLIDALQNLVTRKTSLSAEGIALLGLQTAARILRLRDANVAVFMLPK